MVLQYLVGGNHIDIYFTHGISKAEFFASLWVTLKAMNEVETIEFHTQEKEFVSDLKAGLSKQSGKGFLGCVGAADGISVAVRKPYLKETINPAQYANRKKNSP